MISIIKNFLLETMEIHFHIVRHRSSLITKILYSAFSTSEIMHKNVFILSAVVISTLSILTNVMVYAYDGNSTLNKLLIVSNATNTTSGTEPVIFTAFKFESNTLENATAEELEKIKANISHSAALYLNETIDNIYNATSSNETLKTTVYSSSLLDDIIRILGIFF